MSGSDNHLSTREAAAEHALAHGLRAAALPADALPRIHRATAQEWRAQLTRAAWRRRLAVAAAASMATLAALGTWNLLGSDSFQRGAPLGELSRFEAPGVFERHRFARDSALRIGAPLRPMQLLDFRSDSLVALTGGGNLRVARSSRLEVSADNTVRLTAGELYVDVPAQAGGSRRFVVLTEAGEFRHVGTQFALAIVGGQTRLRVREGSVRWHAGGGDATVPAGSEVLIDRAGTWTRRAIATSGREWAWIEALTPEIEIENRPLAEFLQWAARESGRKLVLGDDGAGIQVMAIRMHGNIHGLTVMEALSAVMASTSLRFDLPGGLIRVSSARDPRTPGA